MTYKINQKIKNVKQEIGVKYLEQIAYLLPETERIEGQSIIKSLKKENSYYQYNYGTGAGKTYNFNHFVCKQLGLFLQEQNRDKKSEDKERQKIINFYTAPFYSHLEGNQLKESKNIEQDVLRQCRNTYTAKIYGTSHFRRFNKTQNIVNWCDENFSLLKMIWFNLSNFSLYHKNKHFNSFQQSKNYITNNYKDFINKYKKEVFNSIKDGKNKNSILNGNILVKLFAISNKSNNPEISRKQNLWFNFSNQIANFVIKMKKVDELYHQVKSAKKYDEGIENYEDELSSSIDYCCYYLDKIGALTTEILVENKNSFKEIYENSYKGGIKDKYQDYYLMEVQFLLDIIELLNPLYLIEFFDNMHYLIVNAKALSRLNVYRLVKKIDKNPNQNGEYYYEYYEDSNDKDKTNYVYKNTYFKGKNLFEVLAGEEYIKIKDKNGTYYEKDINGKLKTKLNINLASSFLRKCNELGKFTINFFIDESDNFYKDFLAHQITDKEFSFSIPEFFNFLVTNLGLGFYCDKNYQHLYKFLYQDNHQGNTDLNQIKKWMETVDTNEYDENNSTNEYLVRKYLEDENDMTLRSLRNFNEIRQNIQFFLNERDKTATGENIINTVKLFKSIDNLLRKLKIGRKSKNDDRSSDEIFEDSRIAFKKIITMHENNSVRDFRIERNEYLEIKGILNQIFYKEDVSIYLSRHEDLEALYCVLKKNSEKYVDITKKENTNQNTFTVYQYVMSFLMIILLIKETESNKSNKDIIKITKVIKELRDKHNKNKKEQGDKANKPDFLGYIDEIRQCKLLNYLTTDELIEKITEDKSKFIVDPYYVYEENKMFIRLKEGDDFQETKSPRHLHLKMSLSLGFTSPEYEVLRPILKPRESCFFECYNIMDVSATAGWQKDNVNQFSLEYIASKGIEYDFSTNLIENSLEREKTNELSEKINKTRAEFKQVKTIPLDMNNDGIFNQENIFLKEFISVFFQYINKFNTIIDKNKRIFLHKYKKEEIEKILKGLFFIANSFKYKNTSISLDSAIFFTQTTRLFKKVLDHIIQIKNELNNNPKASDYLKKLGKYIHILDTYCNINIHKDYQEVFNKNKENSIYTCFIDGKRITLILYRSKIDTKFETLTGKSFAKTFLEQKNEDHKIIVLGDYMNISKGLNFKITKAQRGRPEKHDFNANFLLMDPYFDEHNEQDKYANNMKEIITKLKYFLAMGDGRTKCLDDIDNLNYSDTYNLWRRSINQIVFLKRLIQSNGRIERTDSNPISYLFYNKETLENAMFAIHCLNKDDFNVMEEIKKTSPNNLAFFEYLKVLKKDLSINRGMYPQIDMYLKEQAKFFKEFIDGEEGMLVDHGFIRLGKYNAEAINQWELLRSKDIFLNPQAFKEAIEQFNPKLCESIFYALNHGKSKHDFINQNYNKLKYYRMEYPYNGALTDIEGASFKIDLDKALRLSQFSNDGGRLSLTEEARELIKPYQTGVYEIEKYCRLPFYYIQRILTAGFSESLLLDYLQAFNLEGEAIQGISEEDSVKIGRNGKNERIFPKDKRVKCYREYEIITHPKKAIYHSAELMEQTEFKTKDDFYKTFPEFFELFDVYVRDIKQNRFICIDMKNWSQSFTAKDARKLTNKKPAVERLEQKRKVVINTLKRKYGHNFQTSFVYVNLIDDDETETIGSHFFSCNLFKKVESKYGNEYKIAIDSTLLDYIMKGEQ